MGSEKRRESAKKKQIKTRKQRKIQRHRTRKCRHWELLRILIIFKDLPLNDQRKQKLPLMTCLDKDLFIIQKYVLFCLFVIFVFFFDVFPSFSLCVYFFCFFLFFRSVRNDKFFFYAKTKKYKYFKDWHKEKEGKTS